MALAQPTKELRVVLVGKTGSGKSALGNSLLGIEKYFKSTASRNAQTVNCSFGEKPLPDGTRLVVIDTPALFDTSTSERKTREEIGKCIGLSSPGPHVFIFVLRIGLFTDEELQTIDRLIDLFGEEVKKFVFAVFTRKDDLEEDEKTLDEYVAYGSDRLRQVLMSKCQNRYAAINNRASPEDRQKDVDYILDLTRKTVSLNNGNHYTGAMFTRAEEYLRKKIEAKKKAGLSEAGARSEVRQELSHGQHAKEFLMCIMPAVIQELRVVLVGKTGSGKSVLGNSLLGIEKHFKSTSSSKSTTVKCGLGGKILPDGTRLVVIDTPGVFDTSTSEEQTRQEIGKCIGLSSPGPHVFIFVLQIGRFTEEEFQTMDRLIDLFGEEVKKFVFAVFTRKDDLDDAKKTLDEYLAEGSERLRQVLSSKCQNRYAAINNRASEADRQKDVDYILDLTRKTVSSNNGNHYTGAMFARAEEILREKIEAKKRAGLSEAGARSEVRKELTLGQHVIEFLKCVIPLIIQGIVAAITHKFIA